MTIDWRSMMEKELMFSEDKQDIEILELVVGGISYGININDVKEIIPYEKKFTRIPGAHPHIEGIIMPRDFIVTIVDLLASLKLVDSGDVKNEMLIVTNIQNMNIGFHVDRVKGIHRTTTDSLRKPGKKRSTSVKDAIVAILSTNNGDIEVLELRNIISSINPEMVFV